MRMAPLPISHRLPTWAPSTQARCPKTVRCPISTGWPGHPTSTLFSRTAEWLPTETLPAAGAHHHALRQVDTRADVRPTHQHRRGGDLGCGLRGSRAVEAHRSTTGTPTVVRISVPERTALVTGVFSATSASLARWASSSGPCRVIARSIHRCVRAGTA